MKINTEKMVFETVTTMDVLKMLFLFDLPQDDNEKLFYAEYFTFENGKLKSYSETEKDNLLNDGYTHVKLTTHFKKEIKEKIKNSDPVKLFKSGLGKTVFTNEQLKSYMDKTGYKLTFMLGLTPADEIPNYELTLFGNKLLVSPYKDLVHVPVHEIL